MAVARMKRVELAALLSDRERWLKGLQLAEILEIEQFVADDSLGNEEQAQRDLDGETAHLEREMGDIERVLEFIDRFHRVRPTIIQQFAGIRTYLTPQEFTAMVEARADVGDWVNEADRLNGALNDIAQERAALYAETQTLQPWSALDLSHEALSGTALAAVLCGQLESRKLGDLQQAAAGAEFGNDIRVISSDERSAAVLAICSRRNVGAMTQILSAAGFSAVTLPPFGQAVSTRLSDIQMRLSDIQVQEQQLLGEIKDLSEKRSHLQSVYDHLRAEKSKLAAAQIFAAGQHTFFLRGWVPACEIPKLERLIGEIGRPHHLVVRDPAEDEDPPSALVNQPLVTPFESLLQMFSYPKYGEPDPTRFMAPFFFIAFGFALGDAGYGIVLALVNLALLRFLPMTPAGKKLAFLFILGSIATVIFGLGTGGFFGDILGLRPLFGLDPTKDPQTLLIVALAFGVLQMFYGLFLSGRNNARQNGLVSAMANEGTYMTFLASALLVLIAFMAGPGNPLSRYGQILLYAFGVSVFLVILGSAYGRKGFGILVAIPSGLFKMYNSIGFASDVLSYARLMALALSGAVVGNIVNVFARNAFASPGVGYIAGALIFVFGHAINLALNILGAFVHASRLQYLEFFGKFYEGGGRPFSPLRPDYKYTRIIQKREA